MFDHPSFLKAMFILAHHYKFITAAGCVVDFGVGAAFGSDVGFVNVASGNVGSFDVGSVDVRSIDVGSVGDGAVDVGFVVVEFDLGFVAVGVGSAVRSLIASD